MVGGAGDTYADAKVDFPFGRQVEVDGGKKLVLLLGDRIEVGGRTDRAVVFESAGDFAVVINRYADEGLNAATMALGGVDEELRIKIPATDDVANSQRRGAQSFF